MPDYSAQFNQDRAKSIKTKLTGKVAKIPKIIAQRMIKAIEDKESWVWPLGFAMAVFNDLTDIAIIGSIPFLGTSLDAACGTILIIIFWDIGGMIKWKIRIAIWLAFTLEGILGLAILPEFLPFWIICVWYAHHKVNQKAEWAEKGQNQSKKGKINKEAMAEFK